jgi:hypothetical protein
MKNYFITIYIEVKNNNNAIKYSIIFFIVLFFMINLIEEPNKAHTHIQGKQTKAAVNVVNKTANNIFSSLGKNPIATADAMAQAFGFIN